MTEHRLADREASAAGGRAGDGPSDRSLLRRLQSGQADAATLLYLRYADRLHALAAAQCGADLAARVDPEDIVQSVFRTFFRRAAEGQYDVPEGEEIWKLLLVIALHKIRSAGDFHRAARRDVRRTASGAAYDRALEAAGGRDEVALTVLCLVIDEILYALPSGHRPIIERRIEGYEKIARHALSADASAQIVAEIEAPDAEGSA